MTPSVMLASLLDTSSSADTASALVWRKEAHTGRWRARRTANVSHSFLEKQYTRPLSVGLNLWNRRSRSATETAADHLQTIEAGEKADGRALFDEGHERLLQLSVAS